MGAGFFFRFYEKTKKIKEKLKIRIDLWLDVFLNRFERPFNYERYRISCQGFIFMSLNPNYLKIKISINMEKKTWPQSQLIKKENNAKQFVTRLKPYPRAYFHGNVAYSLTVDFATLTIDKIGNNLTEGQTAPVNLRLITCDFELSRPLSLPPNSYDTVFQTDLGPLNSGFYKCEIKHEKKRESRFTKAYTALLLEQGNEILDFVNFSGENKPIPYIKGTVGVKQIGNSIELEIQKITSSYTKGSTGQLRVRVLSSQYLFQDMGDLNSKSTQLVAEVMVDPLPLGSNTSIKTTLPMSNHPRRKNIVITLSEYQNGSFWIKDWRYLDNNVPRSVFFSGKVTYEATKNNSLLFKINKIECNKEGKQYNLRISLLTSSEKYAQYQGKAFEYVCLGSSVLGTLENLKYFYDVQRQFKVQEKDIKKELVLVVQSENDGAWNIEDWKNMGESHKQ